MPNIKSAKKRVQIAERNRLRNISTKSKVRTLFRKVRESATEGKTEEVNSQLSLAYQAMDKAVKNNVYHKNTAARLKSRLANFIAKAAAPSEA